MSFLLSISERISRAIYRSNVGACGIKESDHIRPTDILLCAGAAELGNGSEGSLVVEECYNLSCTSGCKIK